MKRTAREKLAPPSPVFQGMQDFKDFNAIYALRSHVIRVRNQEADDPRTHIHAIAFMLEQYFEEMAK